ncbi:MAG TPA: NAD(P)H-quinone dehydrogenase [Nakamurella sp.]|nr:NAD(P)H-quinone dehydrogenase [Nakamurella sp.]
MTRIVIMGGGPAGYEAALVAAQHGANVTVIERDGVGGACVLYDCVPSKTFIASAGGRTAVREAGSLGVMVDTDKVEVDIAVVHGRVNGLALAQSVDVRSRLEAEGVQILEGTAALADSAPGLAEHVVAVTAPDGTVTEHTAEVVLIATGASPRELPDAVPDGERILTWRQVYSLTRFPEHLIVIGSGVTGAEFASAYTEMGVPVTLVSSRDRVLPSQDADAAAVIEEVFSSRGSVLARRARAKSVVREGDGVLVTLEDGREVRGSHALMTVGAVPNTAGIGLDAVGIRTDEGGFIAVDRVSRTSVSGIYAAGDCTGVLMLASVAAMQGRIAMWHALGEGVPPLQLKTVSASVFTHPEIATVGYSQVEAEAGTTPSVVLMIPLATNARAKMLGLREGFVKLMVRPMTGIVIGGVVVAPQASELILPITVAVQNRLSVKDLAYTFSVYPSLSGSITELGRQLMHYGEG